MKTSIFIKTFIVIIALSLLGYIIHQNNQATEITELVTKPIDRYDFSLYTDSVCEKIRLSNHSVAKQQYDSLYERIDVYSKIATSTGETFVSDSLSQLLYKEAMQAYWPIFQGMADSIFQSNEWTKSSRNNLKLDINSIKHHTGLNRNQKDSLNKYSNYITGYSNFSSLLYQLENCKDSATYVKYSRLHNYGNYPYNNLTKFQKRSSSAQTKATTSWKTYLQNEYTELLSIGHTKLLQDVKREEVNEFYALKTSMVEKIKSYERVCDDYSTFSSKKGNLETLYRDLANKYNKQNSSSSNY